SSKEKAPPDGRAFRYSGRRSYPPISTSSFRNRKVMRLPSAETLHVAPVSIIAPYPFCSCKPEPCGQENRNSPPSGPMLLADGIFAALGLADAAFIACRHIDNASAAYGPLPMHDLIPISAAIIATVSTSPARQLSPFSAMPALRRWNPDYTGTRFTATGYRGPVHIAAAPSFPKLPSAHVGQERGICRGSVCCLLRPDQGERLPTAVRRVGPTVRAQGARVVLSLEPHNRRPLYAQRAPSSVRRLRRYADGGEVRGPPCIR